jgi:hypothetical protein
MSFLEGRMAGFVTWSKQLVAFLVIGFIVAKLTEFFVWRAGRVLALGMKRTTFGAMFRLSSSGMWCAAAIGMACTLGLIWIFSGLIAYAVPPAVALVERWNVSLFFPLAALIVGSGLVTARGWENHRRHLVATLAAPSDPMHRS